MALKSETTVNTRNIQSLHKMGQKFLLSYYCKIKSFTKQEGMKKKKTGALKQIFTFCKYF